MSTWAERLIVFQRVLRLPLRAFWPMDNRNNPWPTNDQSQIVFNGQSMANDPPMMAHCPSQCNGSISMQSMDNGLAICNIDQHPDTLAAGGARFSSHSQRKTVRRCQWQWHLPAPRPRAILYPASCVHRTACDRAERPIALALF